MEKLVKKNRNKVLTIGFAASSGGHYEQLMMLSPLMKKYKSFVVTEKTVYSSKTSEDITRYYLCQINRKEITFIPKLIVNTVKALRIYIKEKPDILITTGVLAIIPLAFITKIFGGKLIYIESFAKVSSPTLSGKMLYKHADQFYVQWEEMLKIYPNAIYKGGIY